MLKYVKKIDYAIAIRLMAFSALRIGEINRLKVGDIDYKNKVIHILGKGGKRRTVPIDDDTLELIRIKVKHKKLKNGDNVINVSTRAIEKNLKIWAKKAKIERADEIIPHHLRKLFGVTWLENGGDIRTLQQIYGHTRLDTTQRYIGRPLKTVIGLYEDIIKPFAEKDKGDD